MFLLRLSGEVRSKIAMLSFTFQYVSIKTLYIRNDFSLDIIFTFQYVSIKTNNQTGDKVSVHYLHSNMFLLRLDPEPHWQHEGTFTFQYVSIKTRTDG